MIIIKAIANCFEREGDLSLNSRVLKGAPVFLASLILLLCPFMPCNLTFLSCGWECGSAGEQECSAEGSGQAESTG